MEKLDEIIERLDRIEQVMSLLLAAVNDDNIDNELPPEHDLSWPHVGEMPQDEL